MITTQSEPEGTVRVFDPAHPLPFETGVPFPRRQASSSQDYLDAAVAAWRYIDGFRKEDSEGVYWDDGAQTTKDNQTLYNGQAGIAYFAIELAQELDDAGIESIARRAVHRLALHWRQTLRNDHFPIDGIAYGLHLGVAGVGSVLSIAQRKYADQIVEQALRDILAYVIDTSHEDSDGVYWSGNNPLILDGGTILFLLQVYEAWPSPRLRELIVKAGRHVLADGDRSSGGGLILNGTKSFRKYSTPNFELGTAGAAYILVRLFRLTHDKTLLRAAEDAVRYLDEVSVPQDKGFLIPTRIEPDGTLFKGNADLLADDGDANPDHGELRGDYDKPIFYLGACHGPAGTDRLFYELARITGRQEYLDRIAANFDGLESLGAPERTSAGLWSVYYCCGHASLLQFFIGLNRSYPDSRWHDLAVRTASVLLGVEEDAGDDKADWPVSFYRVHPNRVTRGIGYYDGAAGIAESLLQLYQAEEGTLTVDRLADDPFPTGLGGE